MPYRALIQQAIGQDIERRRANPGVQNFGALVQAAMNLGMQEKQEARQEAVAGRTAARTAVYGKYPSLAAKELGMDVSQLPSTATTAPQGTSLSQVTYDEYGNPQTTFKSTAISEGDLAEMYNRTILEIDKANSLNAILPKYKAIPKPTFAEWKRERGFDVNMGIQTGTDEELLFSLGITEEDIQYTIQQHPEVTRSQIIEAIRANAQ